MSDKKTFNYQIIIYPDKTFGSNKPCFTAYCPALEIADSGETIEEALKNIKSLIKFHLECLKEEKFSIPKDFFPDDQLITTARVSITL